MTIQKKLFALSALFLLCLSASAQLPANFEPSYEVASIKPSNTMENGAMLMFNQGKLNIKNFPLIGIISFAYDIKSDNLLTNVPDWVKQQRYDVDAKEDEEEAKLVQKLPQEERGKVSRRMVQKLLEERLHLKLVKEQKEQPVYALVLAKGGSKMKASVIPPPPPPGDEPGPGPRGPGGPPQMRRGMMMNGRGELTATDATTEMLANVISHMPESNGRVVTDKTGLNGHYDFTLKWTPETPAPAFRGADAGAPPPPTTDNSGPTLVTALEEQLGLKLESSKGMVDSYRVENIDKPTEN